jgi:tetratricopeptide (TPR) repeat protein
VAFYTQLLKLNPRDPLAYFQRGGVYSLLAQYDKAPAITKQRLYLETMSEVLPKLGQKIILDEDAKQFLPLMNLTK